LEQHGQDGPGLEHLRQPLRDFCSHARRADMAPEHMLIRLKHALNGLPALHVDDPAEYDVRRARIISFAITSYYSDAG
jgi:hypothetical protein